MFGLGRRIRGAGWSQVKIRALVALLSLAAALSGCSAGSNAILQTLPYAYRRSPGVDDSRLNPNFRYLRVTIGGHVALLVLGDIDKNAQGPIEVWYSAEREVLRLQNGRLVGAVGLTTEWRNVALPDLPSWSVAARSNQPFRWTRRRDVMPGYRFSVKDELALRAVAAPPHSDLKGVDAQRLTWFEESIESGKEARRQSLLGGGLDTANALPPARFAIDLSGALETVVYAEQCLARDLCFAWQRWPAQVPGAVGQKQ